MQPAGPVLGLMQGRSFAMVQLLHQLKLVHMPAENREVAQHSVKQTHISAAPASRCTSFTIGWTSCARVLRCILLLARHWTSPCTIWWLQTVWYPAGLTQRSVLPLCYCNAAFHQAADAGIWTCCQHGCARPPCRSNHSHCDFNICQIQCCAVSLAEAGGVPHPLACACCTVLYCTGLPPGCCFC